MAGLLTQSSPCSSPAELLPACGVAAGQKVISENLYCALQVMLHAQFCAFMVGKQYVQWFLLSPSLGLFTMLGTVAKENSKL